MHPFWSPSTPLCTGILHGVLEGEHWSLGGVWTRGHYKGKSLWCWTCPLHRRGTFLSLFSLMLGLGVKYSTNIRIHVKCQGAAYLHCGRAAALAIVLSGTSPPPCRPGVLLVCFKIHPFLICDPGDWTCNSRRVTSLAACPQVGLYNVQCSWYNVLDSTYLSNELRAFCFFFFLKYWHLLLAHRGEEKAREALVWLRGTSQVWSNIPNLRICSLFFLLWANTGGWGACWLAGHQGKAGTRAHPQVSHSFSGSKSPSWFCLVHLIYSQPLRQALGNLRRPDIHRPFLLVTANFMYIDRIQSSLILFPPQRWNK